MGHHNSAICHIGDYGQTFCFVLEVGPFRTLCGGKSKNNRCQCEATMENASWDDIIIPTMYTQTGWCHSQYCVSVRVSLSSQKHLSKLEYTGRERILAACVFSMWKELISFSCPQLSFPDRTSSHSEDNSDRPLAHWDTRTLTMAITRRSSNLIQKYNHLIGSLWEGTAWPEEDTCRDQIRTETLFVCSV